ncbi:hypothetical protein PLICRDRAFT_173530 [Plicaturopsis crispa FD-325 SS-3]|nr:hypothetical protein PLICRDRAFT_173530 [Plicaturopsis crispa FD-325 SS-3]
MSGFQEAVMYAEVRTQEETWTRLKTLDEQVELRWIMPGGKEAHLFNATDEPSPQILQEKPKELARELDAYLSSKYGTTMRANL